MVSKNIAPGISKLLDAVDMERIKDSQQAMRAYQYLIDLADYLNSPAYALLSERRIQASRKAKKRLHEGD